MFINSQHAEFKEELANAITHGLGVLFGLIGIPLLIYFAIQSGETFAIIGSSVYGISFLMVFFTSTLYHSVHRPGLKRIFMILDHISIYFLIAGSYTPFILLYIYNTTGIIVLAVLWTLTLFGIFYKIFFIEKHEIFSLALYLVMGWMLVLIIKPFVSNLPPPNMIMVVIGGLLYTIGTIFYVWRKVPYHHAIWHGFVLVASICHFIAVWLSVK